MVSSSLLITSIAALSTAVFQVFKPRLPPYSLQIVGLPIPSIIDGEIMTKLTSRVRLHNDNFIGIDVHSLSIDMFYPTWGGELTYIGRVYDHKKQHKTPECMRTPSCRKEKGLDKPVWELAPRSDFQITDHVFASMKFSGVLYTLFHIAINAVKGRGSLVIPTTGVMQVKASSSTPITMSMVCDNSLNLFTRVMVGVECSMNSLDIGWLELEGTSNKLQEEVLSTLKANSTGGILDSYRPKAPVEKKGALEKLLKKLSHEKAEK
jgi:hypothetical protein